MTASLAGRLEAHVRAVAEPRHWITSPDGLARAERYVEGQLRGLGLAVERQPFPFRDRVFENLVATVGPVKAGEPRLLLGAHLDTVKGSPGANDNGSGLAGLVEVARDMVREPLPVAVDLVAFQLEEWQGRTYRVGSRRFIRSRRRAGIWYRAALVYDMIGCKRTGAGTQFIPKVVSWMGFPTTGDFIAALGDWRSRPVVRAFAQAAADVSPDLSVATLSVPLRGWPVWHTRRSDNASFWAARTPSIMITDTGNLRNPRYHRSSDTPEYLDYDFMADVVRATVATLRALAGRMA